MNIKWPMKRFHLSWEKKTFFSHSLVTSDSFSSSFWRWKRRKYLQNRSRQTRVKFEMKEKRVANKSSFFIWNIWLCSIQWNVFAIKILRDIPKEHKIECNRPLSFLLSRNVCVYAFEKLGHKLYPIDISSFVSRSFAFQFSDLLCTKTQMVEKKNYSEQLVYWYGGKFRHFLC